MADDLKAQIEQSKANIREMLKRVPASINSGSVNSAIAYKEIAVAANKLLNAKKTPKFAALRQVENQLRAFQ